MRIDDLIKTTEFLEIPTFFLNVDGENVTFLKPNSVHSRITGIDGNSLAGKTPHEVLPARMADTVMQNYMRCIRSKNQYSYEEVLALPVGEIWWRTRLMPIIEDNVVTGVVGTALDITPSKETERRLAETLETVSRKNHDLEVMTSTTAHDLRGPMRQTKLILEMISDGFEDMGDDKLTLLKTADSVIEKALALIDENLQSAQENKSERKSAKTFDFGHWCADAIAILDPLKTKQITYPEAIIRCEKFVIEIALRNLLDNAVKFSDTQVHVVVEAVDDSMLHFKVVDDGPGLPDFNVSKDGAIIAKQANGNSGVGLSSSRSLIEARQGKLWFEPRDDVQTGSIVGFSLPGEIVPETSSNLA